MRNMELGAANAIFFVAVLLFPLSAVAEVSLPHRFSDGQPALAGEVNANFDAIVDALNTTNVDLLGARTATALDFKAEGFQLDFRDWQLNIAADDNTESEGVVEIYSTGNAFLSGINWDYERKILLRFDAFATGRHTNCPEGSDWWVPIEAWVVFSTARGGVLYGTHALNLSQMKNPANTLSGVFCHRVVEGETRNAFSFPGIWRGNGRFSCLNATSGSSTVDLSVVPTEAVAGTLSLNRKISHYHYQDSEANVFNVVEQCGARSPTMWYVDSDGDMFGSSIPSADPVNPISAIDRPVGYVENDSDCDDGNSGVSPNASEVADGLDNDCDGAIDETG